MIKAVFFDLYGTLAGFSPSRYEIQSAACRQFGITLTEQGTLKGYGDADAFMTRQNATFPLRDMDEEEIYEFFKEYERKVIFGSGVDVDLETAGHIWRAVRAIPYDMVILDDVVPNLVNLKNRGLILGLISNMNSPGQDLLKKFELENHMDFAVTSYEVGTEKPHPEIFERALHLSGFIGNESVHVGDQIGSDVDGAERAGILPVLLDRDRNHTSFNRFHRIESMNELGSVLDSIE